MSMEMHVFLQQSKVPSVDQWQKALKDSGFGLTLDRRLSIQTNTGYSPAVYKGIKTGFEFHLSPASEITETYENVADNIGSRELSANFVWGGDLRECVAAVIASAILAAVADGVLYDPQEGLFFKGDEAIAMARQIIEEVDKLLKT